MGRARRFFGMAFCVLFCDGKSVVSKHLWRKIADLEHSLRSLKEQKIKPSFDLTGQKFGRLTVLDLANRTLNLSDSYLSWQCLCECGNKKAVPSRYLRRGQVKSCGCLGSEPKTPRKDWTNQKFGLLTAISYATTKNGATFWKCSCECGNEKEINIRSLLIGKTKSCGCNSLAAISGKNNHNWNPSLTDKERIAKARKGKTSKYRKWQLAVFKRDGYTCQISGKKGGKICAHHLTPWAINKSLKFDASNGITLHESIHLLFHNKYGYKNATKEDFAEFTEEYRKGKFSLA